jgi:CRP-like cAMP-binding protein
MTQYTVQAHHNTLLGALAADELAFLAPHMEPVELALHDILVRPSAPIPFVYFPYSGIASLVASFGAHRDIELGLIGFEGMTSTSLLYYDDQTPYTTVVQVAGAGVRLPTASFAAALERNAGLRRVLAHYAQAFAIQVAYNSLANGRCKLEERLARWLLMVHDRVDGNSIHLTHKDMSAMLGVRRPGVTVALHILEGKGLIKSVRREIIVKDRAGLIAQTAGAYGMPEVEYARLLGDGPEKLSTPSA